MLQNGMLHWEIARDLYEKGIDRVVYLPLRKGFYNKMLQNEMIIQYNYMIEGDYCLIENFKLCEEMFCNNILDMVYVIKFLRNGELIAMVSSEYLRTSKRELNGYADIPIKDFTPYFNLFAHLAGEENDIAEYVHLYGNAPYPSDSKNAYLFVLDKREKLFAFFEEEFNIGNIEYFVSSAPKAMWNEKGYLNLCEGQHRCVYLLYKGLNRVPVRLRADAFTGLQKWIKS